MSRLSPRPSSTARTGTPGADPLGSGVLTRTPTIVRRRRKGTDIRILDTPDQLEGLRAGWHRLHADVPGPNAELDYLVAQLGTLPPGLRMHVVTVHDDDGVSGVAPLVRSVGSPPSRLSFVETDANGFLYSGDEERTALIDAVLEQRMPLELESLVAGSATSVALLERAGAGWFRRQTPRLGGPSLPIDASWTDPATKLSKGRRADLRRTLRRAQELGEVSLEAEVAGGELERDFDELVRLEARSWKYDAGTALACDGHQREALRRYLMAPQVRDRVLVTRMRIGDELIALDVSVIIGDRLWGIKGGVDERYRPCAAGLHLKALAIREAAARGLERYEFMGTTAPYKEMWGAPPVPLQRVQLYPTSVDGQAALASDAVQKARRALERAIRGPLGAEGGAAAPPESTSKAPLTEQATAATTSASSVRVAARAALRHPGRHLRSGQDRTVCVIEDVEQLEAVRPGWQQLSADTAGPSSELDWLLSHARWRTDEQLCVVTVHHRGELTGAAPLFRSRGRVPRLRLAVLDATGFLYRDEAELVRLVDAVLALPLPLSLDLMFAGAPTHRVVERRLPRGRFVVRSTREAGPSVALDPTWRDPLSKLSSRRRNDLRRKLRKAERAGPVEFAVHAPGDDLAEHFRRFVEVEGSEWKRRAGTALADDDARREELWRYLDTDAVRDNVRFTTLRIGERIVAADLAIIRGGRYWFYKGGYDPDHAKLSPGQLLKVHTLAWAAEQGLERYEFMGDCEPYKAAWGDCQQLVSLRIYGPNAPSAATFGTDALRKLVRVTKRSLARIELPGRDRDGEAPGREPDGAPRGAARPSRQGGSVAPATRDLPMVRTVTDLGPWRGAWDQLVDAAPLPSPFLRSWWLEHVDHDAPRFVLVTDGDELIGGMALQEDRVLSLPCYRVLGHGGLVPDHLDALAAPHRRQDVEVALRSWCARPGARIFDLEGVVDGSLLAQVLPGSVTSERIEEAPFRNLPPDPAQLVPSMSGTERSAVKRGRKKLERAGAEYRIVPADEVDAALGELRRLHHLRWGDRSGFLGQFDSFAASVRDAIERDEAMLHELSLHGRVICVLVEFHLAGRAFSFQDGRDPDPALPSPGSVLQAYAMEHAVRLGRREYDFLRGSFSYKSSWTDDARPVLQLRATQGRTADVALRLLRLREHAGETKGRLRRRAVERIGDGTRAVERARQRLLRRRLGRLGGATVRLVDDPKALEELRDDWRALHADVLGPNSELDWALSYAANLRDHERLCVVTVHDDDTCIAVAPLVEHRRGGGRLELIDNEVCGFLYRDTDALTRLVDAVLALRMPLALWTLPADSPTERTLRARAGRTSVVRVAERAAGPSLTLDPSWSDPLSQLSSSRRRDVKRRLRRAEERGHVEFAIQAPGEQLDAAFEEYVRVEGASWKRREGTALSCGTWERDLLRRYLRSPNVQDRVRLTTLRIAGRVIAADLGVLAGDRYWAIKSSFVEDETELGPGILTKVHTIGWAAAEGLEAYEFLGEPEGYKRSFGAAPRQLRSIRVYPPTPAGATRLARDAGGKLRRWRPRRRSGEGS